MEVSHACGGQGGAAVPGSFIPVLVRLLGLFRAAPRGSQQGSRGEGQAGESEDRSETKHETLQPKGATLHPGRSGSHVRRPVQGMKVYPVVGFLASTS